MDDTSPDIHATNPVVYATSPDIDANVNRNSTWLTDAGNADIWLDAEEGLDAVWFEGAGKDDVVADLSGSHKLPEEEEEEEVWFDAIEGPEDDADGHEHERSPNLRKQCSPQDSDTITGDDATVEKYSAHSFFVKYFASAVHVHHVRFYLLPWVLSSVSVSVGGVGRS